MQNSSNLKVSEINIYPVKSCAGISLSSPRVVDIGFEHDREWMIVDDWKILKSVAGFITQRSSPKMALIKVTLTSNGIRFEVPENSAIDVPIVLEGDKIHTHVWGNLCVGIDQGEDIALWLSNFLGRKCRLIKMAPDFKREIKNKYQSEKKEIVGFADSLPFLVISEESLNDLNSKLNEKLPMNRFRPNIVISGGTAFQEDSWKKIKIGEITFRFGKSCDRCEITTINQITSEKGVEPLEALGKYRTKPKGIMFGDYFIQENYGVISVGDEVEIIE